MDAIVPAHTGGADLSTAVAEADPLDLRPRPHGRGGFKFVMKLDRSAVVVSPPTRAGRI